MIITNKLKLDLQKPGTTPTINAVQNDSYSRNLEIALFSDHRPFVFPENGAVVIRYKKSDGKGGEYDTLPDGTAAWRMERNILTVALAPQVLTTPGSVLLTVTLIADGAQLSIFPIRLDVAPVAAAKIAKSENYFYITGLLPAPVSGNVGQSLRIAAVNGEGRITAVEAVDSGSLSQGISGDPAVYGLPVLYLTGDTTGMSKEMAVSMGYVYGERSGTATVKWQGSSSLSYPKKNYTIEFDSAFEAAAGWGEQKKYCLKANYIDFSHARNVVSAKLWGEIVKSRQDEGGITSLITMSGRDVSHNLSIANGEVTIHGTMYNDGNQFFGGPTYPAGEHTVSFEVFNPNTAENDGDYAVLSFGIPGTAGEQFGSVNVNTKEAFSTWLSRSYTVTFPVDDSMIGFAIASPEAAEKGYIFRNIKIDGQTYPIEATPNALKHLVNGGAVDGFPICVYVNGSTPDCILSTFPRMAGCSVWAAEQGSAF